MAIQDALSTRRFLAAGFALGSTAGAAGSTYLIERCCPGSRRGNAFVFTITLLFFGLISILIAKLVLDVQLLTTDY